MLPPLVSTGAGLAFADDELASVANPPEKKAGGGVAWLGPEAGAACLPPPPANGIVVCAVSGRYPPVKKLKKKKWAAFEEMAGRLAKAVSVRRGAAARGGGAGRVVAVSRLREMLAGDGSDP